jgi:hypothetical protein
MAESTLWEFQSFILDARDEFSEGWGEAELVPWIAQRPHVVEELHQIGAPDGHRRSVGVDHEILWGLYALNRLVDILIGPHQPIDDHPGLLAWTTNKPWWSGPAASPSAWAAFRDAIGAAAITEDRFHPFFHEIVDVQLADDPDEPPSLVAEHWPGAMIGGLLLTRSGVTVRAGANVLDPAVAARSCLYWAWWRRNRVVSDLSHGWGHNSQWRTDFRRDYVVGDELHYNVDHAGPQSGRPADLDEDLSAADRLDLLRFRHSVRQDFGNERWPYYDSHVERRP